MHSEANFGILLGSGTDARLAQLSAATLLQGNGVQSVAQASVVPLLPDNYQVILPVGPARKLQANALLDSEVSARRLQVGPSASRVQWLASGISQDGQLHAVILEVYANPDGNLYLHQINSFVKDGYAGFTGDTGAEANRVLRSMTPADLRIRDVHYSLQRMPQPISPDPNRQPSSVDPAMESMPGDLAGAMQVGSAQSANSFSGSNSGSGSFTGLAAALRLNLQHFDSHAAILGSLLVGVLSVALCGLLAGQRARPEDDTVQPVPLNAQE